MKRALPLITLLTVAALAQAQTTITIPAQTIEVPAQTVTVSGQAVTFGAHTVSISAETVTVPAATTTPSVTDTPATTPPSTTPTPTPSGVTWMYLNGKKRLAGDFTSNGETVNYANKTSSGYNGGTKDILITATVPWAYFLPYWAANYRLPNPGWTKLIFSIKPSLSTSTFTMHAERVGDNPLPTISLASYCGPFAAGKWTSCSVPLSALGVYGDKTLYKVLFQTSTAGPDSWEMDAIGFQ
jgi:hypothetical protein